MNFSNKNNIILFDGVCNLCNSSVNYVIKKDAKNKFQFASLQSDIAKQILSKYNVHKIDLDTIILVQNNQLYTKSSAALRILKQLTGASKLMYVFIIIPKFLRDFIYNIIAKNRYKWFGKQETCMIPTKELKAKFLDSND